MQPRIGAGPLSWSPEHGPKRDVAVLRAPFGSVLVALLVAGCSASSGEVQEDPRPSPTAAGDEDAALAAYTAMWEETAAASQEGGGTTRNLDKYATGPALVLLSEALKGAEGTEVAGEPVLAPEVEMENDDKHARVTDCLDDSGWNLGAAPEHQAGPRRVEAGLVHDGLAWRVKELRIWESGTC